MKCEALQKHLLSWESPAQPAAEASAHLSACAACREWLLRLTQLERAVPLLPVPTADTARSALVRRILAQGTTNGRVTRSGRRPSVALVLGSWILDRYASPRRRVGAGLVAGMAAALLLFITGALVWHADNPPPRPSGQVVKAQPADSLMDGLHHFKVHPRDTGEPQDRIRVMAEAADQLAARGSDVLIGPRAAAEMSKLADVYERVLREEVVTPAEKLSLEERRQVLGQIADGLHKAESHWRGLTQQSGLPRGVTDALERCAVAARDSHERLQNLM